MRLGIMLGFGALAALSFLMGYKIQGVSALVLVFIFSPPFPLHLPRHIWVTIDIISLIGLVYFAWWATDPYQKGARFEKYVSTLFPEPDIIVQDRTRDNSKLLNRLVESDGYPDFVFRNKKTNKIFAVECKWRGQWAQSKNGEIGLWWNGVHSERYSAYEKKTSIPVFIAFGIGGSPEKPKEVYFMELAQLQYAFLKQSFVRSGKSAAQII
jgi:hypothetical protein